jgi:hypothetical protein
MRAVLISFVATSVVSIGTLNAVIKKKVFFINCFKKKVIQPTAAEWRLSWSTAQRKK